MERIDIYDAEGRFAGKTVDKNVPLSPDEYFLHAHMVLCDRGGRFLLQRRSAKKKHSPGVWDITGGGVQAGETAKQAAARETIEELGLIVPEQAMRFGWKYAIRAPYRSHVEVWGANLPIDINALKLDFEEVDGAKFAPLEEYVEAVCWNKDEDYRANLRRFCAELADVCAAE